MEKEIQSPQLPQNAVNHSVLSLKHLSPYIPYELNIYKSAVSQLNEFN
jgi:hypothetical protein